MDIVKLVSDVNDFVWGPVMLAFLVGTGVFNSSVKVPALA